MKMVKIDPPGSFCTYAAVFELINKINAKTFIEVGCGAGNLSLQLCERGLNGVGLDFSDLAIESASKSLKSYIDSGQYRLLQADLMEMSSKEPIYDVGISLMVMEHVEADQEFIRNIAAFVKPGGHLILGVPGRKDKWSIEDETVGHFRRYDRQDLQQLLEHSGLQDIDIWSVAVPTANILYGIGNLLIRHSAEMDKKVQDMREQTSSSGVREIPFKTVFPASFKLLLNRYTLSPLFIIQRWFYKTGLGLTMLAVGRVPNANINKLH